LPAPVVNGEGDSYRKWKDFQLSRARDLDLETHTASLSDLYLHVRYLHANFHWNRRNVLRTYIRTDIWVPLISSTQRVNLNSTTNTLLHD